jgi:hypothetical protein
MGHFWASVHVGVRFKFQVHHHGDGEALTDLQEGERKAQSCDIAMVPEGTDATKLWARNGPKMP